MRLLVILVLLLFVVSIHAQDDARQLLPITPENVGDLTQIASVEFPNILSLDWLSDGRHIVIGTYDESRQIWLLDIHTMELTLLDLGEITVQDFSFTEGEQQIVAYNLLFDLNTLTVERIAGVGSVSSDGELYEVIDTEFDEAQDVMIEASIEIYNLPENTPIVETPIIFYDDVCAYACAFVPSFSPDNSQLAVLSVVEDMESAFIDLTTGEKQTLPVYGYYDGAYSPDSRLFAAVTGRPGYIRDSLLLLDTETAEVIAQAELYLSSSPSFSSSGDLLAIGGYDDNSPQLDEAAGRVYFFDVKDHSLSPVWSLSFAEQPSTVSFSQDDTMLAIYENGFLMLWGVVDAE